MLQLNNPFIKDRHKNGPNDIQRSKIIYQFSFNESN